MRINFENNYYKSDAEALKQGDFIYNHTGGDAMGYSKNNAAMRCASNHQRNEISK